MHLILQRLYVRALFDASDVPTVEIFSISLCVNKSSHFDDLSALAIRCLDRNLE